MKRAELLAPAGNMEKLEMAFHYGADAVFLGGNMFNLRAGSHNFSDEDLKVAVSYAHNLKKKVYVALNVIPHSDEMKLLPKYVKFLDEIKVDGVIVADLGVFQIVKENSNLKISVSTQASNSNWRSVKMWKELGASRIVLAREVSLENIAIIKEKVPDIELEVFIHGAMCMAVSGRCTLSNHMTDRDANRGDCAQSCRWNYNISKSEKNYEEEKYQEKDFENFGDNNSDNFEGDGGLIFNSKDLCTINIINKILDLGIDSLKIEGRMKGIYYVANVVKVYKDALDKYYSGNFEFNPLWIRELETTSHRSFSTGFLLGTPDENDINYQDRNSYSQTHQLVAKVTEKISEHEYILEIRNRLETGDKLEIINPTFGIKEIMLPEMALITKHGEEKSLFANPNSITKIYLKENLQPLDMIRKIIKK
ncbi:MAG: peptidase U32 family protein [Fusobacteriaceae bacterium]